MNKKITAGLAALAIAGGSLGVAAVSPFGIANAQTPTTVPSASDPATGSAFKSNEDPAHEATETAEQEAAEDAGIGRHGGHHGSNEDPAHEATESAEREAAEDAAQGNSPATTPAAPATASS
jgi:hypothetical protein